MVDRVIKPDSGNQLVLQDEGGSAAITIATDGVTTFTNSVGIGTDDPAQQVHISGATPIIQLTDTDTGADSLITASNGTGSLKIQCDNNNETGSSTFEVDIDGSQRMKVDSTGDMTITDGDLVIGTAGHGIDFSNASGSHAGATGSVLDDYETGNIQNFMLAGGVVKTSTNFTQKACTYIKIGGICVVSYLIDTTGSDQDLGTGTLTLGLPFTSHSTNGYSQGKYTTFITGSGFQYNRWCRISNGADIVDLYSGNNTSGTMSGIGNNPLKFYTCLTYMTA